MPARAREREQVVEGRRRLDELGLRRPASPHRNDDDATVAGEDTRDVPGHRSLPDPLPEADHSERRRPRPDRGAAGRSGSRRRRTAARARAPARPRACAPAARAPARRRGRPRDPPRPRRRRRGRRRAGRHSRRHRAASRSLPRAAHPPPRTAAPRAHRARPARSARRRSGRSPSRSWSPFAPAPRSGAPRKADDACGRIRRARRSVVPPCTALRGARLAPLPPPPQERKETPAHVERTSSSIFAVYFSYVFVSVENWMIRSCPWNG